MKRQQFVMCIDSRYPCALLQPIFKCPERPKTLNRQQWVLAVAWIGCFCWGGKLLTQRKYQADSDERLGVDPPDSSMSMLKATGLSPGRRWEYADSNQGPKRNLWVSKQKLMPTNLLALGFITGKWPVVEGTLELKQPPRRPRSREEAWQ